MELRFTQAARKHRVGRGSVRFVIEAATFEPFTTSSGRPGLWCVGVDERGRELEVGLVLLDEEGVALVIHAMPTALRRRN